MNKRGLIFLVACAFAGTTAFGFVLIDNFPANENSTRVNSSGTKCAQGFSMLGSGYEIGSVSLWLSGKGGGELGLR